MKKLILLIILVTILFSACSARGEEPEIFNVTFREGGNYVSTGRTELTIFLRDGVDITPLRHFQNLEMLSLSGAWEVDDLTTIVGLSDLAEILAELPNLRILSMPLLPIEDLAPFANLAQLRYLSLLRNEITDISPLAQMTNLTELRLDENPIQDITPLAQMTQLRELSLNGTLVQDISPLAYLTRLERLTLCLAAWDANEQMWILGQVHDITPLETLRQLTHLVLRNTQLQDLSPLASLHQLVYLDLMDNQIYDLSPLAGLINLEELYLEGNNILDISPLVGLTSLQALDVGENPVIDLSPVEHFSNIRINPRSSRQGFPAPPEDGG